jgi:hypothetical protein
MKFDKKSLQDWKTRNILDISCIITKSGCAGNKIQVVESRAPDMNYSVKIEGITIHYDSSYQSLFETATLTAI